MKNKTYAVMVNLDGDWYYVSAEKPIISFSNPMLYDSLEEAQKEASTWGETHIKEMT